MKALLLCLLLAAPVFAPRVQAQTLEDPEGTVVAVGREDGSEAGLRDWVGTFRVKALEAENLALTRDLGFFEKLMSKAHPNDFMACRPWGRVGAERDRKLTPKLNAFLGPLAIRKIAITICNQSR